MDSKPMESGTSKKPYRKPEFTQIELRPEEAVLGGCKVNAGTVKPGTSCVTCSTLGS